MKLLIVLAVLLTYSRATPTLPVSFLTDVSVTNRQANLYVHTDLDKIITGGDVCVCVRERGRDLNKFAGKKEKVFRDEGRHRHGGRQLQDETVLRCNHVGCSFVALSKAGLINHTYQKHVLPWLVQSQHCGRTLLTSKACTTINAFAA